MQREEKAKARKMLWAWCLGALLVASLGFGAPPARAQEGGAAPAPAAAGGKPAGETRYDFDDDLVTGDLVRPDGELLRVRRGGKRSTLIRIREQFITEMLKSVEDL